MTTSSNDIREFTFAVPEADLDDLRQRIGNTRWPEREAVADWSQGVPLAYVREVCEYWAGDYDWRRCEGALNARPQFITAIDGLDIQFMHIRSPHDNARPLVMTHGWPGSVLEFMQVLDPLSNPTAHGGSAEDAFHLVVPTLPGYGWSGKPDAAGWGIERIARAWTTLMNRLGYARYFAQGGDWGSAVTLAIGEHEGAHCAGIHTNMPLLSPSAAVLDNLTPFEQAAVASSQHYFEWDSGYSKEQSTRPQTVGYGLVDSPVMQAAWILEKFWSWTDCNGHPENAISRDHLLDNIMMYWLPAAGASSARLYWESFSVLAQPKAPIDMPVGASIYPHEIFRSSRRWCEERFSKLVHYSQLERGGHFAAFEQPALFVNEIRECFRHMPQLD